MGNTWEPANEPVGDRALAFHEAGHAVIAYRLSWPITSISTVGDALGSGHCCFDHEFDPAFDPVQHEPRAFVQECEQHIQFFVAGVVAEARFLGTELSWQGSLADWDEALDLARSAEDADGRDPEQRISEQVAAVTAAFNSVSPAWWNAVKAVAAELLKRGELSRAEVIEIIHKTLTDSHNLQDFA